MPSVQCPSVAAEQYMADQESMHNDQCAGYRASLGMTGDPEDEGECLDLDCQVGCPFAKVCPACHGWRTEYTGVINGQRRYNCTDCGSEFFLD